MPIAAARPIFVITTTVAAAAGGGADDDDGVASVSACCSCWWNSVHRRRSDAACRRCGPADASADAPAAWKTWGTVRTGTDAHLYEFSGGPVQHTA